MPAQQSSKNWCFTVPNPVLAPKFDDDFMEYLIFQKETCPSTNTPHYQGYVQFKSRKTMNVAKQLLGILRRDTKIVRRHGALRNT